MCAVRAVTGSGGGFFLPHNMLLTEHEGDGHCYETESQRGKPVTKRTEFLTCGQSLKSWCPRVCPRQEGKRGQEMNPAYHVPRRSSEGQVHGTCDTQVTWERRAFVSARPMGRRYPMPLRERKLLPQGPGVENSPGFSVA